MSTNRTPASYRQAKPGLRRKRTREDRDKRDAAFAPKQRGRPKGSRLKFFEDNDRFAVAIVECATKFRGMPLYHAADIAVALTSDAPIEAASIDHVAERLRGPNPAPYVMFSGGTKHATLKGATGGLVAKVRAPRTREETEWIRSSGFDALLDMHLSPQPYLRVPFDFLAVRGWTSVVQKIIEKLSPAMRSNFPPAEQPPKRRTLDLLWPKPKTTSTHCRSHFFRIAASGVIALFRGRLGARVVPMRAAAGAHRPTKRTGRDCLRFSSRRRQRRRHPGRALWRP